jgi:DNA-binding SARP family transcriptional activator
VNSNSGIVDIDTLSKLISDGRIEELHRSGLDALRASKPPMPPWLLVHVIESASRWLVELDTVDRYQREMSERTERIAQDRERLLSLLGSLQRDEPVLPFEEPVAASATGRECRLDVRSLGAFRVFVDGRQVTGWNGTKSQFVLKFLLTQPRYTAVKDVLMEALWPETDASTSRRRLHQAVYVLRQALAAARPDVEFVLFENGQYLLNPRLCIEDDVAGFEQLVATCRTVQVGDPHRLVELACSLSDSYSGDFLDDTPYEDWAIRERDRLRIAFLTAAQGIAELLLESGMVDDCIRLLQRALEVDPCSEPVHRTLMKAHHDAGRPRFVAAQFGACSTSLKEALGVAPSARTRDLLQTLLNDDREAP